MKDLEIEIKVRVSDTTNLVKLLEKEGKLVLEEHQIDEYFTPAHKNYVEKKPVKEWLRLRTENGSYSINYKNWYYDENGKPLGYCDEYESKVENMDAVHKIFKALDIKPLITVDKLRKSWLYKDYEISMDTVKDLGDFIEIEYKGKDEAANPDDIAQGMMKFLEEIGCGTVKRDQVGYPYLLLYGDTSSK